MSKRIAVLGAGPMGLAVAYQLVRDGYKPVIFEADDRVGGMSAAFDFSGLMIERYYHFHCISDYAFIDILKELNLSHKLHWVETKMGYWFQHRLQPWGNPTALFKFKGLSLMSKLRYGLHAFVCTKRSNWKSLDNIEAISWIKSWVGEKAYEVLWRRLFDYKFYNYSKNLSAAWIWSRIHRIGRSRFNLFREKLGYLEGGSDTLLKAMMIDIQNRGGQFFLKSPVKKIIIKTKKVEGIIVNGKIRRFDKIISTIPLPYLPNLIPDLPQKILKKFKSKKNIAIVCVIVKLKKSLTDNFWLNVNDYEMDIPGIVEYTNLRPLDKHIIYIPFYMPSSHKKYKDADNVFINKVRQYMKKINLELKDEDFIDIKVSRYHFAQPICEPGYLDTLPPVNLPVKGLFAADTSYYYPEDRGISESIHFGRKIAKLVLND